jgi:IclR family acetate operon transcriptional repressor
MTAAHRPGARRVEAVERAIAVLDVLAEAVELGTNEIARRTRINASSVSRLLATLAAAGLVEQVEGTGQYRLGLRLVELGNAALARLDLRELARPHLRALVAATGETATLSVPGEEWALTVDFVRSPASVQGVAQIGRPSVPHATAVGKVLLAFGGVELPGGELHPYTTHTIVDHAQLAREVTRVRAQGWAQATGEREDDLNALAAPVLDAAGELVAVLGVQGPASRFGEGAMHDARRPLAAAASALSATLGWSG